MSEPVGAVAVRPARPEELDEVGALTVAAYRHDGFLTAADDYAVALRDAAARARDAELLVAVAHGKLLGSVTFCPPGSPLGELARGREAEFRMLAVAPDARGQGVAEALVRRCLTRARELACPAVVLSSMPQMRAAHRLYERLGFRRKPELDWSPAPGVDLLCYVLVPR